MQSVAWQTKKKMRLDQRLAEEDYIVFEAGTYTEAIKLCYRDYEQVVKPQVANLAID